MLFWKRKIASDEYAELLNKFTSVQHEVQLLKHLVEKLELSNSNLRGVMSRKLGGKRPQEEEPEEDIRGDIARLKEFFGMGGNSINNDSV